MDSPFGRGPNNSSGPPEAASSSRITGQSRLAQPYAPQDLARSGANAQFHLHSAPAPVVSAVRDDHAVSFPGFAAGMNIGISDPMNDGPRTVWSDRSPLPSFSRAFDLFTAHRDGQDFASQDQAFVPSYLRGSTYIRQLQEAQKTKLQGQKESQRPAGNGSGPNPAAFAQPSLPPAAHRGMTHNVIERPSASGCEDSVAPLPARWNKDEIGQGIEVQSDGLTIKYTGSKNHHEREYEAGGVRADHYMPSDGGLYYFEVQILHGKRDDITIAVGFSAKNTSLSRAVGWEPESWGYHGDDGRTYAGQNLGRTYASSFDVGDVIGCGVNFRDHTAFFTRNGVNLGVAFTDVDRSKMYPTVTLKKSGEQVLANFGQSPFVYNIDDMMREQRLLVQTEIESTDTLQLEPGMNETDLIQSLVLQFLQHDGYVETARAFAKDVKAQKEALNLDPNLKVDGLNIKDDEDANNRQRIRRAVLEGDIERALKYTNAYYPQVLQDNEEVHFKLRCRKFIEMVRKAAQIRMNNDSTASNGRRPASAPRDMDVDGNGSTTWEEPMDMDGSQQQAELHVLEKTMLEYGQTLGAEYAADPRKEVTAALGEIWALVAYSNPLKEPQVSHLLDRKGRSVVAEELNSAILSSLGKSSRASLEKLYAQTSVLLEDLRQDGGPAAFVSLENMMEDSASSTHS
ncbi:hypothetical protein DCS_01574 [Drechmeria coniospora]|uniref:Uncharacterized protein n=1 Tax=Drechmeria coniospora TaxID=98403 RepID=A0A151GTL3_DRECN|nr:hypothetical protein DCS_01574 [Drechmeria coniospora]KYK60437.1 hypothetical protein DCS_01574 [Drechmeria coniospora]ODA80595.1 hypothetical protein RJ55_03554 [Drechmeria coniospora]